MALPGTPGQRISDLCNGNHITQKELAEKIGVSASQLSRIVSGETSDTQLATTRQETFSGRTAMESKMEGTHER